MSSTELIEKINQLPPDKKKEIEEWVDKIILSVKEKQDKRKFGFAKGTFKILPGFDDPIEGMEEYM